MYSNGVLKFQPVRTLAQVTDEYYAEVAAREAVNGGTETIEQKRERLAALLPSQPAEATNEPDLSVWDAGDDDYQIPPRGWLLGSIFCRRFLSSLIADGGVGKTALRLAQLISLAVRRSLTGEHVFERCRVLVVSLEDDRDELRRRVHAVMLHYGISPKDVEGWLFLAAPKGLKLAKMHTGSPQADSLEKLLRKEIQGRKLDVVCLDPFVKSHSMVENDNNAIDFVCTILATLAIEYNCAIDSPHHTNKGLAVAGDANKGRGASSMKDAGRLVYTLTPMTEDEARNFGITEAERRSLVRLDSGKVNITPPSNRATWFKLIGVPLGNATAAYPNGDEVQTVQRWELPNIWKGLETDTLNRILDDIEAGDGLSEGVRYSSLGREDMERAAWRVVQKYASERTPEQCQPIITAWVRTGLLISKDYEDPTQRKPRKGLFVDATKRPGNTL